MFKWLKGKPVKPVYALTVDATDQSIDALGNEMDRIEEITIRNEARIKHLTEANVVLKAEIKRIDVFQKALVAARGKADV